MRIELRRPTQPTTSVTWPEIELRAGDRILVLAPHPDDESLACGGIIQRAVSLGLPVRVVFLTLGDNNEWSFMVYRKRPEILPWQARAMGEMRHDEALAAARTLGLPRDALTFLGYPDFGTLHIWCSHWGDAPPFRSMLTRVASVPYRDAYRRGAPYKAEEIVRDLTTLFQTSVQPGSSSRMPPITIPTMRRSISSAASRSGTWAKTFTQRSIHSWSTTRAGHGRAASLQGPRSRPPGN